MVKKTDFLNATEIKKLQVLARDQWKELVTALKTLKLLQPKLNVTLKEFASDGLKEQVMALKIEVVKV